jgi:hypothetical protein
MTVIEIEPDVVEPEEDDDFETCDPDDYPFPGSQPATQPDWNV